MYIIMESCSEYNDEITNLNSSYGNPIDTATSAKQAETKVLNLINKWLKSVDLKNYTYDDVTEGMPDYVVETVEKTKWGNNTSYKINRDLTQEEQIDLFSMLNMNAPFYYTSLNG